MFFLITIIILTFIVAIITTALIIKISHKLNIMDIPNARSLHKSPVPRAGGVALIFTLLISLVLYSRYQYIIYTQEFIYLLCATGVISLISFVDDCITLSAKPKLFIQCASTLFLITHGFSISNVSGINIAVNIQSGFYFIFCFLFLIWFTNLYNFMDGLDGFASGMTVIGYGTLAYLCWVNNESNLGLINLIISCAAAGILCFNFPPAKIFFGDVGSASIGFFTAGMAILLHNLSVVSLWQSVLIFSPFIVDATWTLFRRLYNKEKVFEAHRSHCYQRLALTIGHKKTVLYSYVLMLCCAVSSMYLNLMYNLGIFIIFYIILIFVLEFRLRLSYVA